jgi:hypothetical protein
MAVNSPTVVIHAAAIIEYDAEGDAYSYLAQDGAWDEAAGIQRFGPGQLRLTLLDDRGIDGRVCTHDFGNYQQRAGIYVLFHSSDTVKDVQITDHADAFINTAFTVELHRLVNAIP